MYFNNKMYNIWLIVFLFVCFIDGGMKHKPDGILINGNNTPLYDHKRKIEVTYYNMF